MMKGCNSDLDFIIKFGIRLHKMKIIEHHPAMPEKERNKKLTEIAEVIIGLTECDYKYEKAESNLCTAVIGKKEQFEYRNAD